MFHNNLMAVSSYIPRVTGISVFLSTRAYIAKKSPTHAWRGGGHQEKHEVFLQLDKETIAQ